MCVHGHTSTAGNYCSLHYATPLCHGAMRSLVCDDFKYSERRAAFRKFQLAIIEATRNNTKVSQEAIEEARLAGIIGNTQ